MAGVRAGDRALIIHSIVAQPEQREV